MRYNATILGLNIKTLRLKKIAINMEWVIYKHIKKI